MTKEAPQCLKVPPYELADAYAIQALARGDASEDMQRRALDWIVNKACATYDVSFQPDGDRETAFAEGRRFIGLQIVKMMKLDTGKLKDN